MEKKLGLKILILVMIIFFSIFSGCIKTDNDIENNVIIKGKDGVYTSINDAVNNCEDGDIIVVGQGTYKEKILIPKSVTLLGENKEKTIIDADKLDYAIYITADFVTIKNFTIKNTDDVGYKNAGIYVYSNNNIISNNKIINSKMYGIYVYNGSNNSFVDNFFSNNKFGIYAVGIGHIKIKNLNISDNTCFNNSELGIYLKFCYNSTIKNNIISGSNYGLHMQYSGLNIISFNLFTKNNLGLFFCCGSENNIVFKNSFMDNYEYNAKSNTENQFDYQGFGNFWADYNGTDNDSDGIGDQAYVIFHNEMIDVFNQDSYPLIERIR